MFLMNGRTLRYTRYNRTRKYACSQFYCEYVLRHLWRSLFSQLVGNYVVLNIYKFNMYLLNKKTASLLLHAHSLV